MYWWQQASELLKKGIPSRFGLITTNSITQSFNRRIIQRAISRGVAIVFAIPDHPWVDSGDGAAVRVAMTACAMSEVDEGRLLVVTNEESGEDDTRSVTLIERRGRINADLTVGVDVTRVPELKANKGLCIQGVIPLGQGFIIDEAVAARLGLGRLPGLKSHIVKYLNGKDLTQTPRRALVIDLEGMTKTQVQQRFPEVYQHVLETVKPERDQNKERYRRENWWVFGRKHTDLRRALAASQRYIATVKTAKHRLYSFLPAEVLPDSKIYAIALEDAYHLGILSSRIHVTWALRAGAKLGVGNDPTYNNSDCFNKFPFPNCSGTQAEKIRGLGLQLDAHRKRQQAQHPTLTLTGIYNVIETLRSGGPLSEKERVIHEQGLVSILKQIHDALDAAVFDAYGWPSSLTDEEILSRLVDLNAKRAAEEAQGVIRWLRPEFQKPVRVIATQDTLAIAITEEAVVVPIGPKAKAPWPKTLAEQAQAVRAALSAHRGPVTSEQLAKVFLRARVDRVEELLDTLASLGQARELDDGRFVAPTISR